MVIEHERNILFVNSVKLYPCLYDCRNPDYNKLSVKENAWKEISKKMGDPVLLCKQRWKNLRTVFIRHLKQKSIHGSSDIDRRKYYLENAMHFVIPFLINKNNSDREERSALSVSPQLEEDSLSGDRNYEEVIVNDEQCGHYSVPETSLHNLSDMQKETEGTRIKWHCSATQKEVDTGKHFVKYVETKKKTSHESADMKFLLSLVPDLKEMNSQQKRRFKRESLELISRILEDPMPENESSKSDVFSSHHSVSKDQSQTSSAV